MTPTTAVWTLWFFYQFLSFQDIYCGLVTREAPRASGKRGMEMTEDEKWLYEEASRHAHNILTGALYSAGITDATVMLRRRAGLPHDGSWFALARWCFRHDVFPLLAAAARSTLVAPYKPSARHLKVAQFDGTHILSAEFADEVAKVLWRARGCCAPRNLSSGK
jgi:hypothetical protein